MADSHRFAAGVARFIANIWQIHPFGEGNTCTTAVFTLKYLNSLGFKVNNGPFEKNSWYFRNSLVRANYTNTANQKSIVILVRENSLLLQEEIAEKLDLARETVNRNMTKLQKMEVLKRIGADKNGYREVLI